MLVEIYHIWHSIPNGCSHLSRNKTLGKSWTSFYASSLVWEMARMFDGILVLWWYTLTLASSLASILFNEEHHNLDRQGCPDDRWPSQILYIFDFLWQARDKRLRDCIWKGFSPYATLLAAFCRLMPLRKLLSVWKGSLPQY